MRNTVVGQVTPHLLRLVEIAAKADAGANVDWHLREAVTGTIEELAQQYNAADLLAAYVHGLESAGQDAGRGRLLYALALRTATNLAKAQVAARSS